MHTQSLSGGKINDTRLAKEIWNYSAFVLTDARSWRRGKERNSWEEGDHRKSGQLTLGGVVVADVSDCFPDDFLIVHDCFWCDLSAKKDHAGFGDGFCKLYTVSRQLSSKAVRTFTASHFRIRILLEMGVQYGVADLVAHLVCKRERKLSPPGISPDIFFY